MLPPRLRHSSFLGSALIHLRIEGMGASGTCSDAQCLYSLQALHCDIALRSANSVGKSFSFFGMCSYPEPKAHATKNETAFGCAVEVVEFSSH